MPWQTKLDTYNRYPFCCQSFQEGHVHTDNAYDGQTAFFCAHYTSYRIIEQECLGAECPDCKLVGFEDYKKNIIKVVQ